MSGLSQIMLRRKWYILCLCRYLMDIVCCLTSHYKKEKLSLSKKIYVCIPNQVSNHYKQGQNLKGKIFEIIRIHKFTYLIYNNQNMEYLIDAWESHLEIQKCIIVLPWCIYLCKSTLSLGWILQHFVYHINLQYILRSLKVT